MDLQKHRSSTRKSKQTKIGQSKDNSGIPLLQEISNLKNQLRSIKSKKSLKTIQDLDLKNCEDDSNIWSASPKSNTKLQKTQKIIKERFSSPVNPFILQNQQYEQNLNMLLDNLIRQIQECNIEASVNILNRIVSLLNQCMKEKTNINTVANFLQISQKGLKEQVQIYQQVNRQLEKQNIEMRVLVGKLEHRCEIYRNEQIVNEEKLVKMNKILMSKDEEIMKQREIRQKFREERQKLEEQMRIYERWIEKKQSKIVQVEEELRITMIEKEKQGNKRREKQKQLQRRQKQYRNQVLEYRKIGQQQEGQIKRLKAEVQQIRLKSKQIQKVKQCQAMMEKQKQRDRQGLKEKQKQKEKLREEIKCLTEEIRNKNSLCEERDQLIAQYQAQNYELKKQNQKLGKCVEMAKREISSLSMDIKEIQQQCNRYKQIVVDSQYNEKNLAKISALKEIKQLIQFHKTSQEQGILAV